MLRSKKLLKLVSRKKIRKPKDVSGNMIYKLEVVKSHAMS